ncbi:hypothetical protein EC558_07985 [Helicobacter pylori]|nr:hypothetical protein EC558_07985 [Helicobacter pylori]
MFLSYYNDVFNSMMRLYSTMRFILKLYYLSFYPPIPISSPIISNNSYPFLSNFKIPFKL